MKPRTLALTKETLRELTGDELGGVVGGITTLQIKSLQDCPGLDHLPTFPVLRCALAETR